MLPPMLPEHGSGHGECKEEDAACECEDGWSGPACQQHSCVSGLVDNVSVSALPYGVGPGVIVESCSEGLTYGKHLACAWQLYPQQVWGKRGNAGGASAAGDSYLIASLVRLQIESDGGFLFPFWPGCAGKQVLMRVHGTVSSRNVLATGLVLLMRVPRPGLAHPQSYCS
jgi:hypothetical protein